jgi:Leucine-rich repeat (LRR) protein
LKEFLNRCKLRREQDVDEIYLPFEDLTEINSLERFKNLTRLWLHSNKLRSLPFLGQSFALSELYLQNNRLKSIEFTVRHLTNLRVLFLHSNELIDVDTSAHELAYLRNLRNLSLFNNPIALEKNYRILFVHKIPSLEIFDRNSE